MWKKEYDGGYMDNEGYSVEGRAKWKMTLFDGSVIRFSKVTSARIMILIYTTVPVHGNESGE